MSSAIMKAKPSSEASMPRPVPKPKAEAGPTEVSSKTETSKSQDELEEWTVLEDKPVGQHE